MIFDRFRKKQSTIVEQPKIIEPSIVVKKPILVEDDTYYYFTCDDNMENYTQRNNEFYWVRNNRIVDKYGMCNFTSYCMFADYAGWKFPSGKYNQPEDNFADFLFKSKEVDKFYKEHYLAYYKDYVKGTKDCTTPNEIHKILSYAFNLWVGVSDATRFIENANIKSLLYQSFVIDKMPLVLSGHFPKSNGTRLHHIVTCTGIAIEKDKFIKPKLGILPENIEIAKIKIDDPYGNTLNDWQGSGNDIWLTWDYVVKNLKPVNNEEIKWAHTIKKPVAII